MVPEPAVPKRRRFKDLIDPARPRGFVLLGVFVAVAGAVLAAYATNHLPLLGSGSGGSSGAGSGDSPGIAVTTVPRDPVDGAAIYPVPNGAPASGRVAAGLVLRVDCVQRVSPNYLLAHISTGAYRDHWIDTFDVKTPRGEDLSALHPPLPSCGPAVTLVPGATDTP